jgi:hypothetical protein
MEFTLKNNNMLNAIPLYNSCLAGDKCTTTHHGTMDLKWSAKEQ